MKFDETGKLPDQTGITIPKQLNDWLNEYKSFWQQSLSSLEDYLDKLD